MALQNPHRVDLGNALARLVGDRMELVELDRAMGWSSSKASRVVAGKKTLSESDVAGLVELLDLTTDQAEELRGLAALARKRKAHQFIADYATGYVSFEQDAVAIDAYSDALIPGLGQCEVYATAVLATAGSDNIAEQVAARIDRQKILCLENPPQVRIVVGEAALYLLVGGKAGLRQQLEHLRAQVDMGRIQLGIDRYSAGAHQGLGSRFNIVRRANGDARVYIESALTSVYLHEPDDVEGHRRIFDRVWERSAKGDESATILRKRIQQLA